MIDYDAIYEKEAEQYDRLIAREDFQGNIMATLLKIRAYDGADIVDLGAGTGRLSCLLAPSAASLVALDGSAAMLRVASRKLQEAGRTNWRAIEADHRNPLPLANRCADVVVAGWTICHAANANAENAEGNLRTVIAEMERIVRPGGSVIVLETMGTGCETPNPPASLRPYYERLVQTYGFSCDWIRTDFRFESVEEAERLTRFFFGDELADRVAREQMSVVPSCTGIWWRHISEDSAYS